MGTVCNCTSRNEFLGLWFAFGQMEVDLLVMGASEADGNHSPPWGSVVKGSCKMRLKDNRRAMEMLDCLPTAALASIDDAPTDYRDGGWDEKLIDQR